VKLAVPILIILALVPGSRHFNQLLTTPDARDRRARFISCSAYTGLLSFGHPYFGAGAYAVRLMMRYLGVASMNCSSWRDRMLGRAPRRCSAWCACAYADLLAILTLALSQVRGRSPTKFSGSPAARRAAACRLEADLVGGLISSRGRRIREFIPLLLLRARVFCVCTALMWLIVHLRCKTLQAIRDNEPAPASRRTDLGVPWLAFLCRDLHRLAGISWVRSTDHTPTSCTGRSRARSVLRGARGVSVTLRARSSGRALQLLESTLSRSRILEITLARS